MSLEIPQPDYLGLPVISFEEGTMLRFMLDPELNMSGVTIPALGEIAILRNPLVDRIIVHDVQQFRQYDASVAMDPEDVDLFCDGIERGYRFLLGCVAWARFSRSGHDDVIQFITTEGQSGLANVTPTVLRRLKDIRVGKVLVDPNAYNGASIDSREVAHLNAGDYCFESVRYEELLEFFASLHESTPSRAQGIFHGSANAIQMYMTAYEQSFFDSHDN